MSYSLLSLSSITYANKAKSYLSKHGIRSGVLKTPVNLRSRGCGYSIKVSQEQTDEALQLLEQAKIRVLDVFYYS